MRFELANIKCILVGMNFIDIIDITDNYRVVDEEKLISST
jgi:hypothetical protein